MAALTITQLQKDALNAFVTDVVSALHEGLTGQTTTPDSSLGAYSILQDLPLTLKQQLMQIAAAAMMHMPPTLPSYTVGGVPPAAGNTGAMIYVSNEAGGAVPAFSDGTNWRRVTDRVIIS